MKISHVLTVALLMFFNLQGLAPKSAQGQTSIPVSAIDARIDAQQLKARPRFEQYPAPQNFKGKPAPVNLASHKEARMFRTNLRNGAKEGPNFAGHYTVVVWGCGTSCLSFAIVDARTGRVYFPDFAVYSTEDDSIGYRLNSRLFIADAEPDGEMSKRNYYKWENNRLVLIYSEKRKQTNE
jgi:hypothetical protein